MSYVIDLKDLIFKFCTNKKHVLQSKNLIFLKLSIDEFYFLFLMAHSPFFNLGFSQCILSTKYAFSTWI